MPYLQLATDQQLYYEQHGEGPPLLLLNGIMMSSAGWQVQIHQLSKEFRVISHDFLGQGQSSKPPSGYSFALHCDHLTQLLDELRLEQVHLVGVSYGAEVGLLYAAHNNRRVKSLVAATAVSRIQGLLKAMATSWIAAAKTRDPLLFFDVFLPLVYGASFIERNQQWLLKHREVFSKVVDEAWFTGFLGLMNAFLELELDSVLPQITCPTLVLAGEEDILKPAFYSRRIAQQIPDSRLTVIPKAGHALFAEAPEEFNQLVANFITEHN